MVRVEQGGSPGHSHAALLRQSALVMLLTNGMAGRCSSPSSGWWRRGSWLEIGLSISNYVIAMFTAAVCFVMLHVGQLGWWLLGRWRGRIKKLYKMVGVLGR